MATYVNNLRLKEIATGAESGTWGTSTNTNLELIADAFGSGTEAITTNADTHTTTVADGTADEGRAIYMKYTGTLDSACTITLAPNTINKFWIIENATSGSQNIIISQGSGANITIGNGNVSAIFTDGAGGGAAVLDALADLELSATLTVAGNVDFNGNLDVDGTTNLDAVDIDGAVQVDSTITVGADDTGYDVKFFGDTASAYMLWDTSTDDLVLAGAAGIDLAGDIDVDGTANLDIVDIDGAVDMASTLTLAGNADFNGDLDVDGTSNLDVVDIDGAVDMASTLSVAGNTSINPGLVAIGSATNAAIALNITSNDMAGTSQYGLNLNPSFTSDATAAGYGLRVLASTDNASFTQTNMYGVLIESGSEGSGSTLTNLYGLKIENQASGGTNYAIHTGTGAVSFGDHVSLAANKRLYLDGGGNTYIRESGTDTIMLTTAGTDRWKCDDAGNLKTVADGAYDIGADGAGRPRNIWTTSKVMINEVENGNLTTGITINQGAADNQIFCLKSSDVNQPATGRAEADTYAGFFKASSAGGGLQVECYTDTDGNAGNAIVLAGVLGEAADTTKSTSGLGVVNLSPRITDGSTGITTFGSNGNLVVITNNETTRFIFDAEGSGHADVEWVAFDKHNDLALLEDLETHLTSGNVVRQFGKVIKYDRQFFEDEGLFHDIRDVGDGKMRGMMNYTRMTMLHSGAIRQVGGRQILLENCLRDLVAANPTLVGGTEALALLGTD